jgi:hypothetical protein
MEMGDGMEAIQMEEMGQREGNVQDIVSSVGFRLVMDNGGRRYR